MGYSYNEVGNRVILHLMRGARINKNDIGRLMNLSNPTVHKYIKNPGLFTFSQLYQLAGILRIDIQIFIIMLINNREGVKKEVLYQYAEDTKNAQIILNDIPATKP